MNKKSNTIKKTSPKTNFFLFPAKLNLITMFLIFILYGGLIFFVMSIIPKPSYTVILDYEPSTYNEEINPYALVLVSTEYNEIEEKFENSAKIYAYIRAMNDSKISRVDYAYSALDNNKKMCYFIETHRNSSFVTPPVSHRSDETVKMGSYLEKIFIKSKYKITVNEEVQVKEIKFSEEVLQLNKRELNNTKYTLTNFIEDVLFFKISFREQGTSRYEVTFQLTLYEKSKPHHINFQTWLVTEDKQIYPFFGLYNFCSNEDFNRSLSEGFYKNLNPKWLYAKLVYTNPVTKETKELFYKADIDTLISK